MGVNLLAPTQAFTAGCDLWLMGPPEQSLWAQKIDWVLNFQVLRASRHEKRKLSPEVLGLVEKSGLELPSPMVQAESPLLIPADLNLPCRWILSPRAWDLASLVSVWRQLGEPSLRVFLPRNQDAEDFTSEWTRLTDARDFQLVVE